MLTLKTAPGFRVKHTSTAGKVTVVKGTRVKVSSSGVAGSPGSTRDIPEVTQTTTDATPTNVAIDSAVTDGTSVTYRCIIHGAVSGGGTWSYEVKGAFERVSGTLSKIGQGDTQPIGETTPQFTVPVRLVANDTTKQVEAVLVGQAATWTIFPERFVVTP